MWSTVDGSKSAEHIPKVVPERVLYEFDGPLVFTAKLGLTDLLFSKIDDADDADLFLATLVSEQVIRALESGKLSLRGAFGFSNCFIVELRNDSTVSRYWETHVSDVPESLLPKAGVGLSSSSAWVVDSIDQLDAFFSVRFSGHDLTRETIPFHVFKKLIDKFYEAIRTLLAPSGLEGARSTTFDFSIRPPALGSLILSIDAPKMNIKNVRKHMDRKDIDSIDVTRGFELQKENFFNELNQLVEKANSGEISDEGAEQHSQLMNALIELLPDDKSSYSTIEFNSRMMNQSGYARISEETADSIRKAHDRVRTFEKSFVGRIEIINTGSKTFVVRSETARQVTCRVSSEMFDLLNEDISFRQGSMVQILGEYSRRSYRDQIELTKIPLFLEQPVF